MYINDIVNSSPLLSSVLFADDTAEYIHNDSIDDDTEEAEDFPFF